MAKKKQSTGDQPIEVVEDVLSKTERYIEDNQRSLMIIIGVIVVIVGGYLAFQRFIVKPMEQEAKSQMFAAERYFEADSFNLALNGDGIELGFLDIIDEYGLTESANLAHYYTGISYLHMGDFESAIEYLKMFDADDHMVGPIALGAIGDAYSELDEKEEAIDFYMKAANKADNDMVTPIYLMKAGETYERMGKYEKAIEIYEKIKNEYERTNEGRSIDKYIIRAELELNK